MDDLSFKPYRGISIPYQECRFTSEIKSGSYAEVHFVTCLNSDYVIKWNKKNDKDENECFLQYLASRVGLSIPIVGLVYNTKLDKNGWIMPKLETNLFHDLFDLSVEQQQDAKHYYIKLIDVLLENTIDKKDQTLLRSIKQELDSLTNLYRLGKLFNLKIKPFWDTYMTFQPDIVYIKDTGQHAEFKKKALRASIELAKHLYHFRIQHNDLHTGNIMRDHAGTYYLIDFGQSRIFLYDKPQRDLIFLRHSIENSIMKFRKDEEQYPVRFDFSLLQTFDALIKDIPDRPLVALYDEKEWSVHQRNDYFREQVIEYILSVKP
jgi:serine/threonine protein kinase